LNRINGLRRLLEFQQSSALNGLRGGRARWHCLGRGTARPVPKQASRKYYGEQHYPNERIANAASEPGYRHAETLEHAIE
jgi:hypothetical protein